MNYLAHLFLSCDDEGLLLGNFIADSMSLKSLPHYPETIQKGVYLHRKIDSFTDSHAKVQESVKLLHPHFGKYSSVILDIYYDYLLSNNWNSFSDENLREFTTRMYDILNDNLDRLPPKMQYSVPKMIASDWLMNYKTNDGLDFVFNKLKNRLSKPERIANAVDLLQENKNELEGLFLDFFPDLKAFVQDECFCDLP